MTADMLENLKKINLKEKVKYYIRKCPWFIFGRAINHGQTNTENGKSI
jgi:hypothetical protein